MNLVGDGEGRKPRHGDFNSGVEVKPQGPGSRAGSPTARHPSQRPMFGENLVEEVCDRNNLLAALKRVRQNKGGPGVDGMTLDQLPQFLMESWPRIKTALYQGTYRPKPVKRVEIPKPGGKGKRKLGIPCVLDRFIQQAVLQVLQREWDPTFSENSYGFRPKRSAHQAIAKAQSYLQAGYSYVVDIDLEKFFDRVCHDRLMSKLAERVADKRVLKLIRSYLKAGIFENGLVTTPAEGTPQGGPLSPFLSNVVLDELDRELEARGHRHVRYADDCNIYVRSRRAGERVMSSISRFIVNRLRLKVNASKSAVDLPQNRSFLGFTFTGGRQSNRKKISSESLKRFKSRVRNITRRNRGWSLDAVIQELARYLTGWKGYFGYSETPSVLRDLDSWIRRRLRCVQWKQWKVYRRRKAELMKFGVPEMLAVRTAWSAKGPWRLCHTVGVQMALPSRYYDSLGLPRLGTQ